MDVVYFIVLVGVLIFVHELGHFACAKFFGVRVLKFSLGFGPRLVGFTRGGTEYVLAALPLGGYVRMLGESPYDEVREEDRGRSFAEQALYKRVIIVGAGPAMNLAFPLVLFFVVFLGDATATPARIVRTGASPFRMPEIATTSVTAASAPMNAMPVSAHTPLPTPSAITAMAPTLAPDDTPSR